MNGLTNATSQNIAWCPKHPTVKSVLSVRRHYPKRGRFTENLSIYLSSPAPNSPLQNPSNFGATASHWLLYILLFFFFLILTRWMRGALCVATRLYILYLAADESISGWEFLLLIPKSPQYNKRHRCPKLKSTSITLAANNTRKNTVCPVLFIIADTDCPGVLCVRNFY